MIGKEGGHTKREGTHKERKRDIDACRDKR